MIKLSFESAISNLGPLKLNLNFGHLSLRYEHLVEVSHTLFAIHKGGLLLLLHLGLKLSHLQFIVLHALSKLCHNILQIDLLLARFLPHLFELLLEDSHLLLHLNK